MTTKVCLLIDQHGVQEWMKSAIQHMLSSTDAELTLVVVNTEADHSTNSFWQATRENVLRGVSVLRQRVLSQPDYLQFCAPKNIDCFSGVEQIDTTPRELEDELGHEISDEVVDQIESQSDAVVRFGFGILKGRVLTAPDYGVLSYHHGDIREYRGVAQGLWNFLNGDPKAGITLQRLTPELDGGEIVNLKEIRIDDCYTWQEVRQRLFENSIPMLSGGLKNIKDPDFELRQPNSLGQLHTRSDIYTLNTLSKYAVKNTVGKFKSRLYGVQ